MIVSIKSIYSSTLNFKLTAITNAGPQYLWSMVQMFTGTFAVSLPVDKKLLGTRSS